MRIPKKTPFAFLWLLTVGGLSPFAALAGGIVSLDDVPHIHAMAVDPVTPEQLHLATHGGLFVAAPLGVAARVSDHSNDLMGYAPHPTDPKVAYASGHPPGGGNLGVIRSDDGGKTWSRWATGANGPVDFHAMDVSKADPDVIYGVHGGLQVSRDGGRSWTIVGPIPGEVLDIAASARDADTLYAATRAGLFFTRDGGRAWKSAFMSRRPATAVHASPQGRLYAFVVGAGLIATTEPSLAWQTVSSEFFDRTLTDLTVDPVDPDRLYALADTGAVLMSRDGGKAWISFEGSHATTAAVIDRGRQLYEDDCRPCHGVRGIGEKPEDMYAKDEFGFVAPPLDDTAHAWHHSDSNLVNTILDGSPRNPRMGHRRDSLSREDAQALVAYIKSLWNFRSLACQGARHMRCM